MTDATNFESLGSGIAQDAMKEILAGKGSWTAVMGIRKATREQRLVSVVMEAFALECAVQGASDVPEECRRAFVAGFMHTVESRLSRKSYRLHEFHNGMQQYVDQWRLAMSEGKTEETRRMRMTLDMAKSIDSSASLADSTPLSMVFSGKLRQYAGALNAANSYYNAT